MSLTSKERNGLHTAMYDMGIPAAQRIKAINDLKSFSVSLLEQAGANGVRYTEVEADNRVARAGIRNRIMKCFEPAGVFLDTVVDRLAVGKECPPELEPDDAEEDPTKTPKFSNFKAAVADAKALIAAMQLEAANIPIVVVDTAGLPLDEPTDAGLSATPPIIEYPKSRELPQ